MSSVAPSLELPAFVDERPISAFQYGVVALCGLVMFIDGFDTQAISYMAPFIAKDWGLGKGALGPVFSSALAGLMVGYLALSPLSDRFGHRRLIIASTLMFALCTLASLLAANVSQLMVLRFLTGLGLGAAAPSAVALTSEYSPKRLRATFVLVIYCGFSLGFVVAGLVAGWLIPTYGWRSMFVVGAIAPLLLVPILVKGLPESLVFMIQRGMDPRRIHSLFRRIDSRLPEDETPCFGLQAGPTERGAALTALFAPDRLLGTLLLWLVFAINLGEFYALQSWLPTILTGLHHPMSMVVTITTLTTVGGIAAAFVTGPCMDRLGAFATLAVVYIAGCVCVAATGLAFQAPVAVLMTANFLAGCCISGGQKSLIALAAIFYPAPMRSTGVGWALGVGRIGGILGPILLGGALALNWPLPTVFFAMAAPLLLGGLVILFLGVRFAAVRPMAG